MSQLAPALVGINLSPNVRDENGELVPVCLGELCTINKKTKQKKNIYIYITLGNNVQYYTKYEKISQFVILFIKQYHHVKVSAPGQEPVKHKPRKCYMQNKNLIFICICCYLLNVSLEADIQTLLVKKRASLEFFFISAPVCLSALSR